MGNRREPHRSKAEEIARRVLSELPVESPTDASIDNLAWLRHVLVNDAPIDGARARLTRCGARGLITVRDGLPHDQRRFAVAHELGHHEIHAGEGYLGLCTGQQMLSAYANSGHEGEANAFAAEFLMPHRLFAKGCDVARVSWNAIRPLADRFQVSLTAAALRFVDLCPERPALVCSKDRKVAWTWRGPDFGPIIGRGSGLDAYSLAVDFWGKGLSKIAETVSAEAWIARSLPKDAEMTEHAISISQEHVLSLLWINSEQHW